MTYLKLAWRNIWRNKRRTLITTSSILFALFFALILRSMQIGTYGHMFNNIVQVYTGYIQIHKIGYWNDRDINNTFSGNDSLQKVISKVDNVCGVVPRLESFALASSGQQTKGVAVVGIEPQKEDLMTHLAKKIVSGRYLNKLDSGVLVAAKLAKYLNIKVNDTLILIGQGYHGASAADKFPVRGILHFPSPDLDNQMVYMSLKGSQQFYSADNMLTSIAINLTNPDDVNNTYKDLKLLLKNKYEIMKWQEILEDVVQQVEQKNVSGMIILSILYLVVAFGIFGTVIMMTAERVKEFGVLVAIGMQKSKLILITTIEMLIVGIMGIISGIALSLPIIVYFNFNPKFNPITNQNFKER